MSICSLGHRLGCTVLWDIRCNLENSATTSVLPYPSLFTADPAVDPTAIMWRLVLWAGDCAKNSTPHCG